MFRWVSVSMCSFVLIQKVAQAEHVNDSHMDS